MSRTSDRNPLSKTTPGRIHQPSQMTMTQSTNTKADFYQSQHITPQKHEARAIGFENELNYCFMITCLQCIVSINELTAYFEQEVYRKDAQSSNNLKFCQSYHDVIKACQSNNSEYKPKKMMKLARDTFDPDDEHDSQEFLRFLLSGMEDELNKKNRRKPEEWKDPRSAWAYYSAY